MNYPIDLYELMPAVYRREDAGLTYPLRSLLDSISTEAGHIQRNITGLWDDFFIETADEWVIPYIADLIGSAPLHPVEGSWRADVAHTISYRRRKGTLQMLEDLAGDVTGWGARVVPFFELMEWAQYLDHLRFGPVSSAGRSDRVGTVNLGSLDTLDLLDGPFDVIAHTADIRPFEAGRGRHNIKKIGFFLWRLRSNRLVDVIARSSGGNPGRYHFSPLGNAAPLFTNDERPPEGQRAVEADLPGPVRPLALHRELSSVAGGDRRYYGTEEHHSMAIAVAPMTAEFKNVAVRASQVIVCNLSDWGRPPAGKVAAIDPVRGRLTLHEDAEPAAGEYVRVSFNYGFSGAAGADLGGGPYDRRESLDASAINDPDVYEATVAKRSPGRSPWFTSIDAALTDWLSQPGPPTNAMITIADSATYEEGSLGISVPADGTAVLRAANGERPVVVVSALTVAGAGDSGLIVDGLAIMGHALRIGDGLSHLTLRHTTLVPGRSFDPEGTVAAPGAASFLVTNDATGCRITLANAIVGPIRVPAEGFTLAASDTIIDSPRNQTAIGGPGNEFGPTCDLRRVTVFGDVRVRALSYASEVIFTDTVSVQRTQTGCIRFSYVQDDADTPRRYRCQPDMALENAGTEEEKNRVRSRLFPRFTTRFYGQPGYAQLASDAADELKTGAENEAEIGAFNGILEAQRVANLSIRLDEYLPAGLEPGLIYET